MPSVSRPNEKPTYHNGQPNKILSMTEVKTYMIRFTDGEGREEQAQVQVFGRTADGGLGVFVVANQAQLQSTLRVATEAVTKGVRARLKALSGDLAEDDLPVKVSQLPSEGGMAFTGSEIDTTTL